MNKRGRSDPSACWGKMAGWEKTWDSITEVTMAGSNTDSREAKVNSNALKSLT